ncbi:DNA translocase FtsK [Massilia antarctica]|uniref:DNA translocase FtsK n=1 Tax=Massilia antarctica TaxID=2765360 RepID=UPI00226D94AD|nr:DNA translocase FtsK [Massilia sp. H27-R4]MCY0916227.1 hypothetical protein [Massilia sp. H27-R4]
MTGLTDARKKLPSLSTLDDAAFVDAVHTMYYPEMDKAELSAKLGYQPAAAPAQSAGLVRSAGDMGIKLGQGVVDLGSAVVGLGSLTTGGMVGKGMRAVGYDPKRTNEFLGEFLSDSQKASDEKVAQADGFVGTIAESVKNPRAIIGSIAQSAPGMLGGMGVTGALARKVAVRAALATGEGAAASAASLAAGRTAAEATAAAMASSAGRKAAAEAVNAAGTRLIGAGALTEGAQTAGNIADRAQAEGREYRDYALPAVGAGLGTALIGLGAGKLMGDAATQITTGSAGAQVRGSLTGRVGKGMLSEGVLEEMPQSAQEQVFSNIAMGEQDLAKGVGNAAGTGLVTGMAMGGGMAAVQGEHAAAPTPAPAPAPGPAPVPVPLPDTGPLSRAANAGQAALAAQRVAAAPPAAADQAPSLGQIDGRLAEIIAIGHGSVAQRVKGADGQMSVTPAVPGRRLTADEVAEFNALKQARKARTEIPAEQQAEFAALLAEEEAAINAKFEPAKAAAAEARALAEEKQIAAMLEEDARAQRAAAAEREAREAQTTNAIIEHERAERAAANRAALRAQVLANAAIPAGHKKPAFLAALKRDGYVNPGLTAEDHADIDDATAPVPSLPNELVDAVPERVAPAPAPAVTNTRAVDDAIAAGMRLKTPNGAMLHKPGSSKVFKLSTAQKAYYQKVMARLEREAAPVAGPSAVAQDAAGIVPAKEAAPQNPVVPDVAHAVRLADNDMLYPQAEAFVRENATASAAALQQHLKVGYNRAQRLLEQMEHASIVSPMASNGARSLIAPAPAAGDVQVVAETAFDIAAHESATSPLNELAQPTEAQKEAGNYKLGRVKLHGLDLSIENPAGSTRSGVDGQGKAWETRMAHHYGYIRGTVGADKDHVDAFIGPNPDSDKVFVVDQVHPESGKFDDHKVMFGFDSLDDARDRYDANYAPGWKGGRHITETDTAAFKNWLASGKTRRPFAESAPRRGIRAVEDMQAEAKLLGATPDQVDGIASGEELWRKNFPKTYGNTPEERKAAPPLGKQELNRMTTRDMTDDQLLQAQKVFAGGPRAKKIEKAIAERAISPMATPEPTSQMDPMVPASGGDEAKVEVRAQAAPAEKADLDAPAGTAPEHARMSADSPQSQQLTSGVIARVTKPGDPFGGGDNMWMPTGLTAHELAERPANSVKPATPGPKSNTLTTTPSKKAKNERSDTGREGAQALGTVASGEDGTAETAGGMERGDADGRDPGAPPDRGAENAGLPATRGGRASPEPVYPADAGAGADGRLGSVRAGRAGTRVSKQDAGTSAPVSAAPSAPNIPAVNFRITEDVRLGQGGEVQKFNDNLTAIRTMRAIEAENRRATPREQAILARYVGWGGLANAFPAPESGEFKDAWKKRGPELAELLTPKEYALARRSTLDSHYTSKTVVDNMWAAARRLGFKGGLALESSMGAGNFLGLMPADVARQTKFVGVEYDNLTARIATLLYPAETVLTSGFQSVPLTDGSFDLSIGNPPFGDQSLRFQFKPEINGHSIHNQFFLAALDAVKPGGLQVQVVSRYLLDKIDSSSRTMLAKKAKLLGAIRLPDTAFKENARTSVVTDIVFLQRLTAEEEANMEQVFEAAAKKADRNPDAEFARQALAAQVPDWVRTTSVADPLGGDAMPVNTYFASNPQMIMGVLERSGSMAFGKDITVRLDDPDSLAERLAGAIARLPQDVMVQTQSGVDAAIARHKDMSDALRIALAGHENGSIKLEAGALVQVIERETPEGGYELSRRTLSPASPWSDALYLNSAGQWYVVEAQLGADGKPAKLIKDGKQTKLNIYDRKVFASEADIPTGMLLGQTKFDRLKQLVNLRDLLKEQLSMEAENAPVAAIEANRGALKAAYDGFVTAHGFISEPANSSLVSNMPDGALVQALEFGYRPAISAARAARIREKVRPSTAEPAPILSKRVIVPYEAPTSADTMADAVAINMAESGRVDIERIASLMAKNAAEIESDLAAADKPLLFKDPETDEWVSRNDYLTGHVKRKLNAARAAHLTANIIALQEVQPEPWGAENVTALLGSSWVPPTVYADFVEHISGNAARVAFSAITNSYSVNGRADDRGREEEWASPGYTSVELISDLLNNNQIKVLVYDKDGKAHIHHENTALALLKAKAITAEFSDWVYKDGGRRNQLVEIFNEKFNTRVNRQHDGSHLILPGKVPDAVIQMRRHQKNTIWRGISERFMLIDHAVGAGKTFTAIARAMERRRMGLSQKPAIIVPNHMIEQFTIDVYRLYPGAKVLAAGKKDFEKSRRRKLFAKIATGDFDIAIIPHSSFGSIGISPATEERYLQKELDAARLAVQDAEAEADAAGQSGFRKPFGVKEAERLVDKITARMERVQGDKTKDRLLTFEQMGIDDLTVDEAHEFKNLFYSSRLTGVKGMGNKTGSQKSFDLYNKVRVLRESPKGTVTFMTGTPISNSAVEMYNMMRFLAADELAELGLEHFDAWRAQFVSTDAGWEPTETGRLKEVNRLGRTWSNMRSLMDLYYSFTDSVDNDDIKKAYAEDNNGEQFPIPRVAGGERQSVVVEPTKAQIGLLNEVLEGFDALPETKDPYERNKSRLRLMDRARKVSLDVRAADPYSKSKEVGGKLDRIADQTHLFKMEHRPRDAADFPGPLRAKEQGRRCGAERVRHAGGRAAPGVRRRRRGWPAPAWRAA